MPNYFGMPTYNPYFQQPMYYQPTQPSVQVGSLQGKIVDSVDVVKAMDTPLDGSVSFFPKADLSEIYTKQLMQDGTSRVVAYKKVVQQTDVKPVPEVIDYLGRFKEELFEEMSRRFPVPKGRTVKSDE